MLLIGLDKLTKSYEEENYIIHKFGLTLSNANSGNIIHKMLFTT